MKIGINHLKHGIEILYTAIASYENNSYHKLNVTKFSL